MNTTMSSLLVAMLVLASVPVSAQMRERSSSASQRPQQQQQQRVQPAARQGNTTFGHSDARQAQSPSRDARGEQHASASDGRYTPGQHPQANRDSDRNSHDGDRRFGHNDGRPGFDRHDGDRRFGRNEDHRGFDQHSRYAGNQGGNGNHYGWTNGNHNGWGRANDPRVDRMQAQERNRIAQGIRSGQLTRGEADRLVAEQRSIQAEERRYRADGVLTRAERTDLNRDLNAASRHIYNETHDDQTRR